jgi:4'-phosphopantetheinyl transferase EntD
MELPLQLSELENALELITPSVCISSCGRIAELQNRLKRGEYLLSPKASAGRYAEFVAGRNCLKQAVKKISSTEPFIGRTIDGKPTLPRGLTGSISHKYPYIVTLAGLTTEVLAIGIDIERVDNWIPLTVSAFSLSQDFSDFENLNIPFHIFSSILFSAKEGAFKALKTIDESDSVSFKEISPIFTLENNSIYNFYVSSSVHQCSGRVIVIDDKWVIAMAWIPLLSKT